MAGEISVAIEVILPKWGMGIEEGTVLRWLRSVGDVVKKGEPIVEIETAKTTQEVEAPASGRILRTMVAEGESAPVHSPIAIIDEIND